jgi:signal transduction histidine kinase
MSRVSKQVRRAKPPPTERDEVLAFVAHELRAPLTAIVGWARLLRSNLLSQEQAARAAETICNNALVQGRLIEDLLEHSQVVHGRLRFEMKSVELVELVASAVESVIPQASEQGIAVDLQGLGLVAPIHGDPLRLWQVVHNLLANAIRFSPRGSRVELVIERAGQHALMRVRDAGIGIDSSFLPHVFERYRRGADSNGLGLGLAIARNIVEAHGGTIDAESDGEGRGATFTVRLPCAERERSATPSAA